MTNKQEQLQQDSTNHAHQWPDDTVISLSLSLLMCYIAETKGEFDAISFAREFLSSHSAMIQASIPTALLLCLYF